MLSDIELSADAQERLNRAYAEIHEASKEGGAGSKFQRMSSRYAEGYWERTIQKLRLFSNTISGSTFLDYGCKFGHLTPILKECGVENIYSVDVEDEHLQDGARFIGARCGSTYVRSEDCYIDIPSNCVDHILVNEVISHINPSLLETFYSECSRVLKVGGQIVISDGNNFSHLKTRQDLIDWYEDWESGSSKELGDTNYEKMRFVALRRAFQDRDLSDEELAYYARNTSGMHGERLIEVVRKALDDGVFTERPHRPGIPPIHPNYGVAMERAFYPLQVEMSLRTYGLTTEQVIGSGEPRPIRNEQERGRSKSFVVRGTKLAEDKDVLKRFAEEDLAPPA